MNSETEVVEGNRGVCKFQYSKEGINLSDEFKEVCNLEKKALNLEGEKKSIKLLNDKSHLFLNLQILNLSHCDLVEIPTVAFNLKYLRELNLSNNSIKELPEKIGNLCNLRVLKLSNNKLENLPKSLKNTHQLNYLDLKCNNFYEVPDILFYGLHSLQVLDLSCNRIFEFDDTPACMFKLVVLGLSDNSLHKLPIWIFDYLCQLKYLDISRNPLRLGYEVINYYKTGIFETLQYLNIENCNLSHRNIQFLSFLTNLEVLRLGNKKYENNLRYFNYMGNSDINLLKNVKYLYLENVKLAFLPTNLSDFKNLTILDLSYNLLSWLPDCFCDLTSLTIVNLSSNQLLFVPSNIGNLKNLQQIHLESNKLSLIPDSFYSLNKLEFVDLYNNNIEKINPNIFKSKNLKGIDLGLNCIQFTFCEWDVDVCEIKKLYSSLKETFRKVFNYVDSRYDLQNVDNESNDSSSHKFSFVGSFESGSLSDVEDLILNKTEQTDLEEEDWEEDLYHDNEDENFDPNEVTKIQTPANLWESEFQNNFCPAVYHSKSVMRTCLRNIKLASENESVEGQFDSD